MNIKNLLLKHFDKDLVDQVLASKKYRRLHGVTNSPISKRNIVDLELCKNLYENYNLPLYKIAMLYGTSDATIRTYFIENNIVLKGHKCGKNSNNNYFENIDSYDKAYFLGLVVADGCIMDMSTGKVSKKSFSIELTESDKYILEKFNLYANFNTELTISHKESSKPRYALRINGEKVYDDLYSLGVHPRKSKENETCIPNIKNDLIPHFIRGVFDGDGIAFAKRKIGFCGCKTLMIQIRDYLVSKGMKNNKVTYNKFNHIYYIQWSRYEDYKIFFDLIYNNKQDLYLIRKYNKMKNNL